MILIGLLLSMLRGSDIIGGMPCAGVLHLSKVGSDYGRFFLTESLLSASLIFYLFCSLTSKPISANQPVVDFGIASSRQKHGDQPCARTVTRTTSC